MCQNDQWPLPETFFVQVLPHSPVHWHPKSQRYRRGCETQTLSGICTSCSSHKQLKRLQTAALGITSTLNQAWSLPIGKQKCDTAATGHQPHHFPHRLQILTLHQDKQPQLRPLLQTQAELHSQPWESPQAQCCTPQRG